MRHCPLARRRAVQHGVAEHRLVFGLALAAILCHSLFYNDFFEDPTTWLLIGLVAFGRVPPAVAEPRVEVAEREAVAA